MPFLISSFLLILFNVITIAAYAAPLAQDDAARSAAAVDALAEIGQRLSLIPPGTPAHGGGTLSAKGTVSAPSGQATAAARSADENFHVAYCSTQSSSGTVVTVLGFTDGTFIFSSDPAEFAVMASACPSSPLVSLHVLSQTGQDFDWDSLTVFHQ
jgi:hypothetical protein